MPTTVDSPVNRPPKSKSDEQYTITDRQVEHLKCQGWRYLRAAPVMQVTKDVFPKDEDTIWTVIDLKQLRTAKGTKETKLTHGTIFDLEEL